jgi:hypothetical protein
MTEDPSFNSRPGAHVQRLLTVIIRRLPLPLQADVTLSKLGHGRFISYPY